MVAIKIGGPAGGAVDGKWNDGRAAVVVKIGGLAGERWMVGRGLRDCNGGR